MKKLIPFIIFIAFFLSGCSARSDKKVFQISEGRHIVSDSGMVVSAHRESSRIGVAILRKGGNAVDAAVATGFALAVCYPEAGNIGGGGFMVIRDSDGRTDMIDYREAAPALAYRDMFLDADGNVTEGLSTETHLSSGVPGTVDGMINIHSKYGILTFSEVIQPAIDLARNGFPVTEDQAADFNDFRDQFVKRNLRLPSFVRDSLWEGGDTLKQPELAATLERIRDSGRAGFYSGTTARLLVREENRGNGIISAGDLEGYQSEFRDPLTAFYRGYKVISTAPPSGGGTILLGVLGMIEPYRLNEYGFHSAESVHLMVEAEKRAYADRSQYLGDPASMNISAYNLLDPDYLHERMKSFNTNSATPSSEIYPGSPLPEVSEETTHYSVVDYMGGAVAATTTLNGTFGNGIIVDSAGFLMNNEMDDFSAKPGFPNMYGLAGGETNSIGPGKRMLSSMTPVIIEKDGKLFMVAGSPGGSTIPTTVLQVVVNVIDFGMNIFQAVDTGRFHHQWLPDIISYERNSIDSLTLNKLVKVGHFLRERPSIGRVNAIMILPDGSRAGSADHRGDNSACGY